MGMVNDSRSSASGPAQSGIKTPRSSAKSRCAAVLRGPPKTTETQGSYSLVLRLTTREIPETMGSLVLNIAQNRRADHKDSSKTKARSPN